MTAEPSTVKRMRRIWATIEDIPPGSVANYGQIAEIAGIRRGARQVGYALRQLPPDSGVPWHRVIQSTGRIAFPEGSDAFNEQRKRLIVEGVTVRRGKVDMRIFRWQPDLDELLWKRSDCWDGSDE